MKNVLKVFGIIVIVALIGFSMAACEDSTDDGSNNDYDYTESNGKITITKYKGTGGNVTVPSNIDGKPVASIGNQAFSDSGITSITIPDSVTSIGDEAFFQCRNLSSVTIGNGIKSIGDYAFYLCTSLTNITMQGSVTSIGQQAFWQCTSLTSVSIPSSVTAIKRGTFQYCSSLTSVSIPNSVTTIEKEAFSSCTSFTSITIPSSVNTIEEGAFSGCTNLTNVTFQGTINKNNFNGTAFDDWLYDTFYATDSTNGTLGTYTRNGSTWTKQ